MFIATGLALGFCRPADLLFFEGGQGPAMKDDHSRNLLITYSLGRVQSYVLAEGEEFTIIDALHDVNATVDL